MLMCLKEAESPLCAVVGGHLDFVAMKLGYVPGIFTLIVPDYKRNGSYIKQEEAYQ